VHEQKVVKAEVVRHQPGDPETPADASQKKGKKDGGCVVQ
jgi:hypothetical protein